MRLDMNTTISAVQPCLTPRYSSKELNYCIHTDWHTWLNTTNSRLQYLSVRSTAMNCYWIAS